MEIYALDFETQKMHKVSEIDCFNAVVTIWDLNERKYKYVKYKDCELYTLKGQTYTRLKLE